MRELVIKLRFTAPCLGRIRKGFTKGGEARQYFILPRDPVTNKVMFQRQWWLAILKQAAEILCRHQQEIPKIRFHLDIDGEPQPIPQKLFKLHINSRRYSKHEAYFPGDEISVTCIVPNTISDEDFLKLMQYAGRYYGISPAYPGNYGFFEVISITPAVGERGQDAE